MAAPAVVVTVPDNEPISMDAGDEKGEDSNDEHNWWRSFLLRSVSANGK